MNLTPEKWTLLLLSLIFVSLLQVNRMHCKKLWFELYIHVCTQSEIRIFRTLVVRCKHTWNENFWHTFSLYTQYFQLQTKNFNETPECWILILAGCKYICGPAKLHLQPRQTYVWPAKWVIMGHILTKFSNIFKNSIAVERLKLRWRLLAHSDHSF